MNRINTSDPRLRKYIGITIRLTLSGIGITLSRLLLMLIGVIVVASIVNPAALENRTIFMVRDILLTVLLVLVAVLLWLQNRELLNFVGVKQFLEYRWLDFYQLLLGLLSDPLSHLRQVMKQGLPLR